MKAVGIIDSIVRGIEKAKIAQKEHHTKELEKEAQKTELLQAQNKRMHEELKIAKIQEQITKAKPESTGLVFGTKGKFRIM